MCTTQRSVSGIFGLSIKNSEENERLAEARVLPVRIRQLGPSPIKVTLDGFKKNHLAIWKTASETGFESVPDKLEDVLTIRFVLQGSIVRKEFNSEIDVDPALGFASLFVDMDRMRTTAKVNMISCTVGAASLMDHMVSLDGDHFAERTSLMPVATTANTAIKSLRASLLRLHERMKIVSQSEDIVYPLLEELIIYHFLSSWPRKAQALVPMPASSPSAAKRARDYILVNLDQPMSLSEVAKVAGVSVRTLQQSFRKEFDQTPIQFITDSRMIKVHEILSSGLSTGYVAQIAAAWGFVHPADFARRYKAKFGVSPSETRRRGSGRSHQ